MQWIIRISILIGTLLIINLLLILPLFSLPGPATRPTRILIEPGTPLNAIIEHLTERNVIAHPFLFWILVTLKRDTRSLQAGEYLISPGANLITILNALNNGHIFERSITVVEGMTVSVVVQLLENNDSLVGTIDSLPEEGSLLSATYRYTYGTERIIMIARMQEALKQTVNKLWPTRQSDLPYQTIHEALTLASIIEKETGIPEERARIAGVFVNRLRQGIPLQADPTVIYALLKQGRLERPLTRSALRIDSPYNTYRHVGLPPGPIANVGIDTILAALHPENHAYLYFVADGTGGHAFAETLADHNRNVIQWRQIQSLSLQ